MERTMQWLNEAKALDVMTRAVIALAPGDRLEDAIGVFVRERISGAPVVDCEGQCVGVLSASDIVRFDRDLAGKSRSSARHVPCQFDTWNPAAEWWRQLEEEASELSHRTGTVGEFMTRDVVAVAEDTPLEQVLSYMIDANLHRVIVLDAERRLVGLITTTDVVAAVLRLAHEV